MYEKLNRKALYCMYVTAAIEFVVTAILFAVVGYLLLHGVLWGGKSADIVGTILYILIPVDLIFDLVAPRIRYQRYRYRITPEEIDIREGLLVIRRELVPIERLHKIEVTAGPLDRMFGLAKVGVTTAGGDVTIRFLENEKADLIAESLKRKINEIVLEEKTQMADKSGGNADGAE